MAQETSHGRGPVSPRRRVWGAANIIVSGLILWALMYNIQDRIAQHTFDASHFFHFFTVQTTVADIAVLFFGGVVALVKSADSRMYTAIRASIVAYAVITGVIYNTMLATLPSGDGYVPTSDIPSALQHVWVPLFLVAEWVLMPGRPLLTRSIVWIGLSYPVLWMAGTAIRGFFGDGWFPYFFVNPDKVGSIGLWLYLVGIAGVIGLTLALCATIGRRTNARA